jgi:hypothetical protein
MHQPKIKIWFCIMALSNITLCSVVGEYQRNRIPTLRMEGLYFSELPCPSTRRHAAIFRKITIYKFPPQISFCLDLRLLDLRVSKFMLPLTTHPTDTCFTVLGVWFETQASHCERFVYRSADPREHTSGLPLPTEFLRYSPKTTALTLNSTLCYTY